MRGSPDYELRQRTQNLNMLFDRRGDVVYWDDFESPTEKGDYWTVPAAFADRSSDVAKFGDYSLKVVTGALAPDQGGVTYRFTDFVNERIGSEISFATEDADWLIYHDIIYHDGTDYHRGRIRINDDGSVHVRRGNPPGWIPLIPATEYYPWLRNWGTVKLVIDIETNMFVRAIVFGTEYDLSLYALEDFAPSLARHVECTTFIATDAAASKTGYFDDFIKTTNEP